MKTFVLALFLLFGVAQAQEREALTDIGSTAIGIALGAAEANPIGIATIPLKFWLLDRANTLTDGEKQQAQSTLSAMWHGATVNNVCVIASILTGGTFAPACLIAGLVAGVNKWQSTAMEREFWSICAYEKQRNPALQCAYTTPI